MTEAADFDGPWKEGIDLYFRSFIDLLFPAVGRDIDWSREVEFADKELTKIAPAAAAGTGVVDKLIRVWSRASRQELVFVHVEVQSQHDTALPQRMYRYNHRLEERYGSMPVSLAVLGDDSGLWRPDEHQAGRWGCEVRFTFPVAKVLDWKGREAVLEAQPEPFSALVLAHLATKTTARKPDERLAWKLRIVKRLYHRGMSTTDLFRMYQLVDMMMALPPVLAGQFDREIEAFEEEREMPIISPSERRWLAEGRQEGRQEGRTAGLHDGIEVALDVRFGGDGLALMPRVRKLTDPAALAQLHRFLLTAPDLEAVRGQLPASD